MGKEKNNLLSKFETTIHHLLFPDSAKKGTRNSLSLSSPSSLPSPATTSLPIFRRHCHHHQPPPSLPRAASFPSHLHHSPSLSSISHCRSSPSLSQADQHTHLLTSASISLPPSLSSLCHRQQPKPLLSSPFRFMTSSFSSIDLACDRFPPRRRNLSPLPIPLHSTDHPPPSSSHRRKTTSANRHLRRSFSLTRERTQLSSPSSLPFESAAPSSSSPSSSVKVGSFLPLLQD